MHFTKFEINAARRGARTLLASPHTVHAAVLSGFPPGGGAATSEGRVLWRIDNRKPAATLFIVSPQAPDLTHLVEQAGWPATQSWDTRDYAPVLGRLEADQRWAFRLHANPTLSARVSEGADTRRVGHVTVDQQLRWLTDRAERAGFTVPPGSDGAPQVSVTHREVVRFRRGGGQVTLATATFEGLLEVTDADSLRGTLTHGLGPAKGYGCGLMTLAR